MNQMTIFTAVYWFAKKVHRAKSAHRNVNSTDENGVKLIKMELKISSSTGKRLCYLEPEWIYKEWD